MLSRGKIKDKTMFFRRKTKKNHEKLCFPEGKSRTRLCFFVGKPRKITPNPSKMQEKQCFPEGKSRTRLCFFVGKPRKITKNCVFRGKIKDKTMCFRRKTKENHAKSVQTVRKLVFSVGKTKEKQKKRPKKKKRHKKNPPVKNKGSL